MGLEYIANGLECRVDVFEYRAVCLEYHVESREYRSDNLECRVDGFEYCADGLEYHT